MKRFKNIALYLAIENFNVFITQVFFLHLICQFKYFQRIIYSNSNSNKNKVF